MSLADRAGVDLPPRKLRLYACLVACAWLLAGGCSAIRTVYNQAEHLVAWRLDDYFQLDDAQRRLFHARFADFHRWHRRTALPAYVVVLGEAERRLERGPRTEDVDWLRTQARSQARSALAHANADIAALLATLADSQVARARQRFERDNRRYAQEHGVGASPEEQRRLRARRDIERIEHWTGALSRTQAARIAELSAAMPLDAEHHARDRRRRQRDFLALLAHRADAERFPDRLQQWLRDWDATRPSDLAAELERFDRARAAMLSEAYALLDSAQRRRVQARTRWYAEAVQELASR